MQTSVLFYATNKPIQGEQCEIGYVYDSEQNEVCVCYGDDGIFQAVRIASALNLYEAVKGQMNISRLIGEQNA